MREMLSSGGLIVAPTPSIGSSNLLTRLLVIVFVATVPAIAALVNFQRDLLTSRKEQAHSGALRQAELLNTSVGTIVEGTQQLMMAITHFDRVTRFDANCGVVLQGLQADIKGYDFLAITDPDGHLICSSRVQPPAEDALRGIAQSAISAGHFITGHYTAGTAGQPAYLSFGLPFALANGKGSGVVVAGLSLDWFRTFLASLKRPARTVFSVVDKDGTVLAREPDPGRYVGKPVLPEVRALMHQPAPGTATVPSFEGLQRIVGYVPVTVDPEGLYVSAGFIVDDLTADIDAAAWRGYATIALAAGLSLGLALIVGQRFVRAPTAELLRAARGWGSGDLTVRAKVPSGSAREFYSLGAAFNAMAETLQQQRSQLQSMNEALELRVAERTHELLESNNRLQVEITEREVTEGRLRQAQKLQAVGQLAGGLAHDFNNLLTAVLGSLELLRRRIPAGDDRLLRLLDTANAAVERGARLTSKLLGFSRRQPLLSVPIDVAAAIEGMAGLITSTLGGAVWLETKLSVGLWPVSVDPNQFEAAILNLALNARDAMPDGGRLTILASNRVVGPEHATVDLPPGEYVSVTVADSGRGMSEETLARVFEPFFTTQAPGMGSGLGLSQVHGMVRQSGGDVRIETRLGIGTRVTMLLPRSLADPVPYVAAGPPPRAAPAFAPDRTMLLVDDDDDVREVTAALLSDSGYTVLQAASGASALELLADASRRIRFVIADYAMPGMTGRELLNHVRQTRPDLPFLLITGYADFAALTDDGLLADQIVRKPFRSGELIDRIQLVWERKLRPVESEGR